MGFLVPVDTTRFLTPELQLEALELAKSHFMSTGENSFEIELNKTIGEGYLKKTNTLMTITKVQAVFRNNQPLTVYSKLR